MSPQASRAPRARHRRVLALLLPGVLGLAAVLGAAPGASAATSCPDADATPGSVGGARSAAALACLVDHEREAAGLPALSVDTRAQQAAQGHADDMAARNYFSHDAPAPAPNGTNVGGRLEAAGYGWDDDGENLGRGQPTPRVVMGAWLASISHCSNLMATGHTNIGIGVSTAKGGPFWVQVFARPSGVPAPEGASGSCPRLPALPAPDGRASSDGGGSATTEGGSASTTSGSGTSTGFGTSAPGTAGAPAATAAARVRATGRRIRRRLQVRVTLPAGSGSTTVVVRVRQRGRTVRTIRTRLSLGRTHRLGVSLPAPRAGRFTVRVSGRTLGVSFR